ncbi:protein DETOXIFICATION 12 [Citrus sinensis]|nr:protein DETOXIFICATION 12 [Citrus sinensis]
MEESLLIPKESLSSTSTTWDLLSGEVKKQGYIAAPMVAVTLSQYLLQVVSMMMVGHLGQLALSSTAMAISLASVTGFSVRVSYNPYIVIYTRLFILSFDRDLHGKAASFGRPRPPDFTRSRQVYNLASSSSVCLCSNAGAYSIFSVSKFDHSHVLKLLCLSLFAYSHLLGFGIQVWTGKPWRSIGNWAPISMELFRGIGEFFHFAIPSAVMVCLEWWSFELLILMSGLLPNPQLETSVLSVWYVDIDFSQYYSNPLCNPYGLGAAVRVSNELGAGNVQRARVAVYAVVFMAVMETIIVSASLFASRRVFGYVFSNEGQVVDYVTTMAPLVCLSVIMDSLQGVFSGVARGCGWQNIAAFVNLGAYYLCGVPTAAILGFWLKSRGRGLWIGIQAGAFTQTLLLGIITTFTDWEKQFCFSTFNPLKNREAYWTRYVNM